MKLINIVTLILVIIGVQSFSCSPEPILVEVYDIYEDLRLDLFQNLKSENSYLWKISTTNDEFCEDSRLLTQFDDDAANQTIYINGLEIPVNCVSDNGVISSTHSFSLQNGQINTKILIADNILNSINIQDDGELINLNYNELKGANLPNDELFKIHINHLWVGYYNINQSNLELFLEMQNEILSLANYEVVGEENYGYFKTELESSILYDPETLSTADNGFAVKFEVNIDSLGLELNDIAEKYRNTNRNLEFFIATGSGTTY